MKTLTFATVAVFAASKALAQSRTTGIEQPTQLPQLGSPTVQGCFSSAGELVYNSSPEFNTIGVCAGQVCKGLGKAVAASTGGNQCYCGDEYPPANTLVDDSFCNVGCAGFDPQACGGINYWTVYNVGINLSVPNSGANPSSSGGSGSSATQGGVVSVTVTNAAQSGSGGGTNTAGIAAGVVVAVVVIAGIVGGIFFWMRRRRNQEIEDEHRRNAAVSSFVGSGRAPTSSAGFSSSDSRLDPVMAQRRMSDGSIADNQDYSRKILRVTNA